MTKTQTVEATPDPDGVLRLRATAPADAHG
jgi:hypothetical protein